VERKVQNQAMDDVEVGSFEGRPGHAAAGEALGKDSQVTRSRSRSKSPADHHQSALEILLPSYKKYEANKEAIQSVDQQLSKVKMQKQKLQEEMDKLDGAKATIQNIKRKKQLESELRECIHNITKFSRYLKEFT